MTDPKLVSPHQSQPVRTAGASLQRAKAAMLMIHGRGARAEDILSLTNQFDSPEFAYLAPQALDNTWYPNRFLNPISDNEPWLTSGLTFVGDVFARIIQAGIPPERIILLGFSQGACLNLEFAARNAQRFGGVVGLSGALIGSDDIPRDYSGSLSGTPVFLGCSDVDFHVPKERVDQTAGIMQKLGGKVTERLYPKMDHVVNQEEIDFVRNMMHTVFS